MVAMSLWELAAVVLAIAYLLLAIRQNIACWAAAIASAAIYTALMFEARLYMETLLQLFYIGMAVYGWASWRQAGEATLRVSSWPLAFHLMPMLLIALLTFGSGALLSGFSDAASPYLDSFTTWGAMVTTWMVARKVLQNWHYWFVIDSVSVYLYVSRDLLLTAALFLLYLALIVVGYRQWRLSMQAAS
jgi:nicotinamide mononucleotide transporter